MQNDPEVIVVGAGAAGLMCARELAQQGKKVVILEARDRVGGRIWQVDDGFGFPVQAGAEFIHGKAAITKALLKEAGLTFVPLDVAIWEAREGKFVVNEPALPYQDVLNEKLQQLKEDLPIAEFLEKYFGDKQYDAMRAFVTKRVERYDAADPKRMSTLALKEEWLGGQEWEQGKIKEGYGALLRFLESECRSEGVEIYLNQAVSAIEIGTGGVQITCRTQENYTAQKVVVTAALPTLKNIHFEPALPGKMAAVSKIGSGGVIKTLLLFDDRWWANALEKDPSKMVFVVSDEAIDTWWGQYGEATPLLVGWSAGPAAEKIKDYPSEKIVDLALTSLVNIFSVKREMLEKKFVKARVINWLIDDFTLGAYSYSTPGTEAALAELERPVDNRLFFTGEAFYRGQETATVEGALASGQETAKRVLSFSSPVRRGGL